MNRREEFVVGDRAAILVDVRSGSVDVRTGSEGHLTVTVDGSDAAGWDIDQLGDTVSVRAPRSGWRTPSARVLVEVPEGCDVEVKPASADATLSGVLGSTRVKTASGDVRVGSVDRLDIDSALVTLVRARSRRPPRAAPNRVTSTSSESAAG